MLPPALDVSPDQCAGICSGHSRFSVWFLQAVGEGCRKKRLTWLAGLFLLVLFHVRVPLLERAEASQRWTLWLMLLCRKLLHVVPVRRYWLL